MRRQKDEDEEDENIGNNDGNWNSKKPDVLSRRKVVVMMEIYIQLSLRPHMNMVCPRPPTPSQL